MACIYLTLTSGLTAIASKNLLELYVRARVRILILYPNFLSLIPFPPLPQPHTLNVQTQEFNSRPETA